MRSVYGEAQGCPTQGQQCYRHLLTRQVLDLQKVYCLFTEL